MASQKQIDIHNCSKALKNTYTAITKKKECSECSFSGKTDREECGDCGEELKFVFPEQHRELAEQFLRKLKIRDMRDAFRTFLRKNPEKRIRITVELYKNGKVSLMRAAELAEMDIENYKEELLER